MGIVIGPILKRANGYGFDVWTEGEGVRSGYPYRLIEHAYYARNASIRASARDRARAAIVCETLDEFVANSMLAAHAARRRGAAAGEAERLARA